MAKQNRGARQSTSDRHECKAQLVSHRFYKGPCRHAAYTTALKKVCGNPFGPESIIYIHLLGPFGSAQGCYVFLAWAGGLVPLNNLSECLGT